MFEIIPFSSSIETFAKEKNRLRSLGTPIEDFNLLIGAAAINENLCLVTDNIKHFQNINNIDVENWVER